MRRKLFFGTIIFLLGIGVGDRLNIYQIPLIILLFFTVMRLLKGEKERRIAFIIFTIFILGIGRIYIRNEMCLSSSLRYYEKQPHSFRGRVIKLVEKKDRTNIYCKVNGEKILCIYKGKLENPNFIRGKEIIGTINPRRATENRAKAEYTSYIKDFLINTKVEDNSLFNKISNKIIKEKENFFNNFTDSEEKDVLQGIMFGTTDGISKKIYEMFRKNGTAHVLAVSGLHVGILYSAYGKLPKGKRTKLVELLFLTALFIYGTASMWSVSVTKAILLIAIKFFADMLERRYDLITGLGCAALIMTFIEPYYLFDTGFHMSFLAVMSIGFLGPIIGNKLGSNLGASLGVQIGLLPYMLWAFGEFSFIGILANIPTIFVTSMIVSIGVFDFFLYFLLNINLYIISTLLLRLTGFLVYVNNYFGELHVLRFYSKGFSGIVLLIIYFLMFFLTSEYFQIKVIRHKNKKIEKNNVLN